MKYDTAEMRATRGAKRLDKKDPGWALEGQERSIDLTKLNVNSSSDCPLGQRFGNSREGEGRIRPWWWFFLPQDWVVSFGFLPISMEDREDLNRAWTRQILQRRRD